MFIIDADTIKLGDLGFTKQITTNINSAKTIHVIGLTSYMSPELWTGDYYYNTDIWYINMKIKLNKNCVNEIRNTIC